MKGTPTADKRRRRRWEEEECIGLPAGHVVRNGYV